MSTTRSRGSHYSVSCPCGWHGNRHASSTQPCPSCGERIDILAAKQSANAVGRAYRQRERVKQVGADERIAAAKAARLAEEAEADRRAGELLRRDTVECRPLRRAT